MPTPHVIVRNPQGFICTCQWSWTVRVRDHAGPWLKDRALKRHAAHLEESDELAAAFPVPVGGAAAEPKIIQTTPWPYVTPGFDPATA